MLRKKSPVFCFVDISSQLLRNIQQSICRTIHLSRYLCITLYIYIMTFFNISFNLKNICFFICSCLKLGGRGKRVQMACWILLLFPTTIISGIWTVSGNFILVEWLEMGSFTKWVGYCRRKNNRYLVAKNIDSTIWFIWKWIDPIQ